MLQLVRRFALAFVIALVIVPSTLAQGIFLETHGFATKTGFRGVFAWKASQPVNAIVRYGTSPTALTESVQPLPPRADTAGMAIAFLTKGQTYYWRVEDTSTGAKSEIKQFNSENAYTNWNGSIYTINLLVQLDLNSLPADIPADMALSDIAAGINIFAERFYDALDGYGRIGTVLITDTVLDYPLNTPAHGPVCVNEGSSLADVLIQTTVPFDSHTWSGWSIDNPCVSFYVGRIGQLVVPWENDLHFGYVSAHEMSHYALNAPDLYLDNSDADCRNLDWDGSLMHNTGGFNGKWELTELDRNPVLTPCNHGTQPYSWEVLRQRYTNIPANDNGPIAHLIDDKARGNEDGGALQIFILNREADASTLTAYTPVDGVVTCGNALPQVVDAENDATGAHVIESTPAVSEPSLDVTRAWLRWDPAQQAVKFHILVKDLQATPPLAGSGHHYRFFFDYAGARYQVRARSDATGTAFSLADDANTTLGSALTGTFDPATDTITITLKADTFAAAVPAAPRIQEGAEFNGFEILSQRLVVALTLTADTARGICRYVVNQENQSDNAPPVAVNDTAATSEDTAVRVSPLANDSDPEGDPLTVQSVNAAAHGSVRVNLDETSIDYTPAANFSGTDTFSYVVTDGKGGTATANIVVNITPVQDAPKANDDAALTSPGQSVTVSALANDSDPDGDTLRITTVTNGRFGSVTTNGTTVTYRPGGGFVQSDRFTYTISDGKGGTSTANVDVFRSSCLGSTADDLEMTPDAGWTFDNAGLSVLSWMHVIDPFASSPTHSFFSDATDVSASKDDRLVSAAVTFTPATKLSFWHRYRTEERFDGGVLEVSTNGGLTWVDVLAAGGSFNKGGYTGEANSINGRLAWTGASSSPTAMEEVEVSLGALAGKTGRLRWRLVTDTNLGDAGWWIDDIRFTDILFSLCGGSGNRFPTAGNDSAATQENTAVAINVLANDSDPDGDTLTISSVGDPANGSASASGATITYTPTAGFAGTDTFTYTVSDGWGGSDTAQVTVTVNGRPDAQNDSATTPEDRAVTVDVTGNDSDPNGDTLSVTSVTQGAHGSTNINPDGSVQYQPNANFHGTDSFSYTISDGNGGSDSATVTITVTAVNDAPTAVNDSGSCRKNQRIDIAVLSNDSDGDGDAIQIASVTKPASGGTTIINTNGTIRYRAKPGFTGSDTFSYTIEDGNGGAATATVTISVTAH